MEDEVEIEFGLMDWGVVEVCWGISIPQGVNIYFLK
jgi:hypothetical protein